MRSIARVTKEFRLGSRGQSTIEFSFAAIILLFLIWGLVQSVRWVIMDSAQRRFLYEQAMTNIAVDSAAQQLNPHAPQFYDPDLEYRRGALKGTF